MTIAWYDPTNHHVSTDKNDPLFTPLGQLWPLVVQREWVGLSSVDFNDFNPLFTAEAAARWAETKLKERNA